MSKRIPLEFYNHLRSVREAKIHEEYLMRVGRGISRVVSLNQYNATRQAYETALRFRDILEREQLNQETER